MSEFHESENIATIKVLGVGGAGGNALDDMIESGITGVEFIAANTDAQDLKRSKAEKKMQLGERITKGLGAGADPNLGRDAAEEEKDNLKSMLENTDLLFITAGMGGGTGTGASPVVARLAKEMEVLTVAVVTRPFSFEGLKRRKNAEQGIQELRDIVDTLVIIPNDKLFELPDKKITLKNAFEEANNILKIGIKGIADLIINQGYINLDFADVKAIISESGIAMLGFGYAEGEDRSLVAAEQALSNPLLESSISGARRVLLNVTGGYDLGLNEANEIANIITSAAGDDTTDVIFGTVLDETMENSIKITIIATDFNGGNLGNERRKVDSDKKYKSNDTDNGKKDKQKEEYSSFDIPAFIRRKK